MILLNQTHLPKFSDKDCFCLQEVRFIIIYSTIVTLLTLERFILEETLVYNPHSLHHVSKHIR